MHQKTKCQGLQLSYVAYADGVHVPSMQLLVHRGQGGLRLQELRVTQVSLLQQPQRSCVLHPGR